jgi:DNA repair photolyase
MSRFTGHAGEPWGSFIDVKKGGCLKGNIKDKTLLFGSVTDPYNHFEKRYENTRSILEDLLPISESTHVELLTKSSLVLRDIDLLKQFKDLRVGISLSTIDTSFSRIIEPSAASPARRIEAIKELHAAGITVYVFISPIFPFLSDWRGVVKETKGAVDMVCFENLNLRGRYKSTVLQTIHNNYPEVYTDFKNIYSSPHAFKEYWQGQENQIDKEMQDLPHKIYFYHSEIKKR